MNTTKEQALHWRGLARKYHEFGFNVVPLGNDKRPVVVGVGKNGAPLRFRWEEWGEMKQDGKLFDALLEPAWWAQVRGVAAVCGPVSGDLACFDFDHCHQGVVSEFLRSVGLPDDYAWTVRTPGGGWHVWVASAAMAVDMPKGKLRRPVADLPGAWVELRWTGHYTAMPESWHPSGGMYAWANEEPIERPVKLP